MVLAWGTEGSVQGRRGRTFQSGDAVSLEGEKNMGYLGYLIAGLMVLFGSSSNQTFDQGFDKFLSNAADINWILLWVAVGIWAVFVIIPLLFNKKMVSGAFGVVMLALPLVQLAIWWLNTLMANAYDAHGVTDPLKFWFAGAFTLMLGWG